MFNGLCALSNTATCLNALIIGLMPSLAAGPFIVFSDLCLLVFDSSRSYCYTVGYDRLKTKAVFKTGNSGMKGYNGRQISATYTRDQKLIIYKNKTRESTLRNPAYIGVRVWREHLKHCAVDVHDVLISAR